MHTERETLREMLNMLEQDHSSAPALKGAIAFAVLRLVIIYLIAKVR